jgi:putative FmdB family regulatory protein
MAAFACYRKEGSSKRIQTWPPVRASARFGRKEETMPTYEFQCEQCKKTFTEKQTFAEHDEHKKVKCPKCRSTNVRQIISPAFAKTSKKS